MCIPSFRNHLYASGRTLDVQSLHSTISLDDRPYPKIAARERCLPHWRDHWSKVSFQLVSGGAGNSSVDGKALVPQSKPHRSKWQHSLSCLLDLCMTGSVSFLVATNPDLVEYWRLDICPSFTLNLLHWFSIHESGCHLLTHFQYMLCWTKKSPKLA